MDPSKPSAARPSSVIPEKGYVHFFAGGLGGMCGAIATAPFDVVKTRLQSTIFSGHPKSNVKAVPKSKIGELLYHFVETGAILRETARSEGYQALFRGLGPTLVGAVPARSINFYTYGNGKLIFARLFNDGKESAGIHLLAAANAGIVTAACTNPIWVVKTRLQLQNRKASEALSKAVPKAPSTTPHFSPSFSRSLTTAAIESGKVEPFSTSAQCIAYIWRTEGVRGFYKGLSASLLGVSEGTIQWTLYERFKRMSRTHVDQEEGWFGKISSAGGAKLIATLITYPHEVVRTRLRQVTYPPNKYHGLLQSFKLVLREEGVAALYSGLTPHLLRVVPNAAVMYAIYEGVLAITKTK